MTRPGSYVLVELPSGERVLGTMLDERFNGRPLAVIEGQPRTVAVPECGDVVEVDSPHSVEVKADEPVPVARPLARFI
jgi:hypothetical protein